MRVLLVCVSVATIVLVTVCSCVAGANQNKDVISYLASRDQLFVATVDTIRMVDYVPRGNCGNGLSSFRATEYVLRVAKVLHGGSVTNTVAVRSIYPPGQQINVGAKVLAFGTRICPDEFRIWGNVMTINHLGELKANNQLSELVSIWSAREGRPPSLADLTAFKRNNPERVPVAAFRAFKTLELGEVISRDILADRSGFEIHWRPLSSGQSSSSKAPNRLVFYPAREATCTQLAIGDTILVPIGSIASAENKFYICPNYFKVEAGFLPGLGLSVEALSARTAPYGASDRTVTVVREEQ